jgi:hypothetical protein
LYRQDNANKNVCIYQGPGPSDWLCSSDLPYYDECVFTIKVHNVSKYYNNGSAIYVGVIDSNWKRKEIEDTDNHFVALSICNQKIWRPNQEQTDMEYIECGC